MNLLEMSFSAAVLILLTLVLRKLLINRLPKRTFLALWAVALLRLLLPFRLPARVSVYNAPQMALRTRGGARLFAAAGAGGNAMATAPARPALTAEAACWLIGLAACALFFFIAYLRCRRSLRDSLPVADARALRLLGEWPLRRKVTLRFSWRVRAPISYGLLHPVILMPADFDWGDERRARYVLAHEMIHIRRFDGVAKLLLICALCVHWFNPLVWAMFVVANRDLELSCDENVVRTFGQEAKAAYALALIGMEETKSGLTPLCNSFSKTAIEERIRAIMKLKKTTFAAAAGAMALVLCVTTVFATTKSEAPLPTPPATQWDSRAAASMLQSIAPYAPFGLSVDEVGQMIYQGRLVREFSDGEMGIFITKSLGTDYPEGAIDLQAVYENGALSGLREVDDETYARRTEERQLVSAQNGLTLKDGRLPEGYAQARYADLLDLRPAGVENLSVGEYRAWVHQIAQGWKEDVLAQRIDEMTSDPLLEQAQFSDPDAFFLMNTLRLTIMDNWRAWSVNLGAVINDGEAVVNVDFVVNDPAQALVGARDGAFTDVLGAIYALLGAKSPSEMADVQAMEEALSAMAEDAATGRASQALSFEVSAYYGYLGETEQGEGASEPESTDPVEAQGEERKEIATAGDYQRMLSLMGGHETQPVDTFAETLLRHMEDEPGFSEAYWRVYDDLLWGDEHYPLTPAQRSFLTMTLAASNQENAAMVKSEYLGQEVEAEFAPQEATRSWTVKLKDENLTAMEATMYYAVSYRVLDGRRLTVGDRDRRLAAMVSGMNAHFEALSQDEAAAATEADVLAWYEELARKCSDGLMRVTLREDGYLGYQVFDQRQWIAQRQAELRQMQEAPEND